MTESSYDELAQALREYAGRFGETAFTDRRRLISLLSDRLPEARRDIRVVSAAFDERVFETLARTRPEQVGLEIERMAARLESSQAIRSDIALPVVQACAYGLGLGPLPSASALRSLPSRAAAPSTVPADDGWIGVSDPVGSGPAGSAPADRGQAGQVGQAARTVTRKRRRVLLPLLALGGLVTVCLVGLYLLGRTAPNPTTGAQVAVNEQEDFGVAPINALKVEVGSPTPTTIPGARVVITSQVQKELHDRSTFLLIDALADTHPRTIRGALYLPNAGRSGTFYDQAQRTLVGDLARLTQGQTDYPLVFFCKGVRCWESYNAVLRALAAGYRNVFWYRGGLDAWAAAGNEMQPTPPSSSQ